MKKAPSGAFPWLEAATTAFTFDETLLRQVGTFNIVVGAFSVIVQLYRLIVYITNPHAAVSAVAAVAAANVWTWTPPILITMKL